MSEPDMIEPVVHEKSRKARKKTRLMWSWRFGPIPELHGAVSPQKPDGSLTAAETNELSYSVVSDPGNQIASALGIVTEPSAQAVAAQKKLGLELAEHNADGGRRLPMPTTVVVDDTGVIRWIDVHPNYTARSEVSDILAAVDALT